MSNPENPVSAEVDPSENPIHEGGEQSSQAGDEGENSSELEVDPSEAPKQ